MPSVAAFTAPALVLLILSSAREAGSPPRITADTEPAKARSETRVRFSGLPFHFEENVGQTDPEVRYLARTPGAALFVTASGAALVSVRAPRAHADPASGDERDIRAVAVWMRLVGADPRPEVRGVGELAGKVNWFVGDDPSRWRTAVPTYSAVACPDVYPGIDLVYHARGGCLEYDFVVRPGADPSAIRLEFDGADAIRVARGGDLEIDAGAARIRHFRPVVYQEAEHGRTPVEGAFRRMGQREFAFAIGPYDRAAPLIVDPALGYSTYFGGAENDAGASIALGADGSVFVAGRTTSLDFPTANARQPGFAGGDDAVSGGDAYVARFNAAGGALVYSTYLGGSDEDEGVGIAVDQAGNAFVIGRTQSADFPTASAMQPQRRGIEDVFVTKLDPTGATLLYSTYLGGADAGAFQARTTPGGIAVHADGSAFVTGRTGTNDFPTTAGAFQTVKAAGGDAFVTKLNASGSALVWSTYLGGSGAENSNASGAIAVDTAGNAYVTGDTSSADFPTVNAAQATLGNAAAITDVFVAKVHASGASLVYSTFLGGSSADRGAAVAVDGLGRAHVTGSTDSADFPTVNAVQPKQRKGGDAFAAALDASGGSFVHVTYLGGKRPDGGRGIAADAAGNSYVTGFTRSANFPRVRPVQSKGAKRTFADAFVTMFDPAGSKLLFSTFLGAKTSESGQAIAVDAAGVVYVVGETDSGKFRTVNPLQPGLRGAEDVFVAKFTGLPQR